MRGHGPWIATAASIAVLLGGWIVLTWGGVVSDLFLPGPDELWDAIVDLLPRVGWYLRGVSGTSLGWMAVVGESPVRENTAHGLDRAPE